jgi:hypothetical protein
MRRLADGGRRWVIAIAVVVGIMVGFALPDDWNVVVHGLVVALVTAATMIAINAVRPPGGTAP